MTPPFRSAVAVILAAVQKGTCRSGSTAGET
jgi:hypothetical protein